jgi:hypothetical protein
MNQEKPNTNSPQGEVRNKSLNAENLKSRREFLKRAARKSIIPAVVIYSVHKMTPPAFGRSPI